MTRPRLGISLSLALLAAAGQAGALAPAEVARACGPVPVLKADYLACERSAVAGDMPTGEIARCSVVYERLKETAFDGSFRALRDWYETMAEMGPEAAPRTICG